VVSNLGSSDIDARLEELLIDGILYAFQEQVCLCVCVMVCACIGGLGASSMSVGDDAFGPIRALRCTTACPWAMG